MGRNDLINALIEFSAKYNLFSKWKDIDNARERIEKQLEKIEFVDALIHLMLVKAKYRENMDFDKLNKLVLELEKIREELGCKKW
jgi:hypothetical protein